MGKIELEQENKVLAQNLEDTEIVNKALEKKIQELERENEIYKKANAIIAQQRDDRDADISKLENRIEELEAQIEKMKNWCNCKNYLSCLEECCRKNISFEKGICYNCKKWELRR